MVSTCVGCGKNSQCMAMNWGDKRMEPFCPSCRSIIKKYRVTHAKEFPPWTDVPLINEVQRDRRDFMVAYYYWRKEHAREC